MADVAVPAAPPLATLANVELMHTGTWSISTGEATFTTDDLAAAVAALDCPAVRRPVLKLGHTDPRFDGEPAVGWVANMAVAEDGRTLVGDYTGMPGWLGDVMASAYPDRSVEGQYDFRCQMGHTHPFVLTGVALLGVTAPGIGTLESLQDVATLYGVAASTALSGTPVTLTIHASAQEVAVPNPRPLQVAAAVTSEDVRRAFYSSPAGSGYDVWIESMELDPLQLIVMNDASGTRSRVPVAIGAGDGEDAVSFGAPVDVVIRYEDAPATAAASAPLVWASRTESRPAGAPASKAPVAPVTLTAPGSASYTTTTNPQVPTTAAGAARLVHQAAVKAANTPKEGDVQFTDEQQTTLRTLLGITDEDALEPDKVLAAIGALNKPPQDDTNDTHEPEKVAAGKKAAGTITIDASAWDAMQERTKRLEAEATRRARDERDQVIAEAVRAGKFPPARKEHWVRLWDADPEGAREVLAGLKSNVVPVEAEGFSDDGEAFDDEFAHLFAPKGA